MGIDEKTNIGAYLKSLRDIKGISLREVERKTGVSNAVLSQIESGQVKRPSPGTLFKLAEIYSVPYEDLMQRVGYPVPARQVGEPQSAQSVFNRLGTISQDEDQQLLDYLAFLRSRNKRGENGNEMVFLANGSFRKCPRQWFYKQCYASSRANDPMRREAHRLSKLENIQAWRGKIVDTIISETIVPNISRRQTYSLAEAKSKANELFISQRAQRSISKGAISFYEVEYGLPLTVEVFQKHSLT
jgi:transcriptional regulator with XRE-family HTH domain